jgi:hypothetical protein
VKSKQDRIFQSYAEQIPRHSGIDLVIRLKVIWVLIIITQLKMWQCFGEGISEALGSKELRGMDFVTDG